MVEKLQFKNYVKEAEAENQPIVQPAPMDVVESNVVHITPNIVKEEISFDVIDTPDIVDEIKPEKPVSERRQRKSRVDVPNEKLTEIVERLESLEKSKTLVETVIEQPDYKALLETMNAFVTRQMDDSKASLMEMYNHHLSVVSKINENQERMVETQNRLSEAILSLTEKISALIETPPTVSPVINIPAPVVNVTTPMNETTRRLTKKVVERDENGQIASIIEEIAEV